MGLYVPGGTAVLPSTALMLGIPAQVAGCKEIVLATPPRPDGSVSPEILYVAKKVGASKILLAGKKIPSVSNYIYRNYLFTWSSVNKFGEKLFKKSMFGDLVH